MSNKDYEGSLHPKNNPISILNQASPIKDQNRKERPATTTNLKTPRRSSPRLQAALKKKENEGSLSSKTQFEICLDRVSEGSRHP